MSLLERFIEAGLLQFGWFPVNGHDEPVRFQLDMLASYPDLLAEASDRLAEMLPPLDRLLSTSNAVALGAAVSLKSGVPLVYSRGSTDEPAFDLVGAYDIGHPAVLLTSVWGAESHIEFLATARRVGLNVQSAVCLIDLETESALPAAPLFRMGEVLTALLKNGTLPQGQVQAVEAWLAGKKQG